MKMVLLALLVLLTTGSISPAYDVILVRSDLPPDWVIAETYSHRSGIPIVATLPDVLEPHVKTQLSGYRKAGFERVLIIGGEAAISPAIQREVDSMGFATHRISEADRYGTSARVAIELYSGSEWAVLVSGEDFEDLLTARRVANEMGAPILFAKHDEVPVSVLNAMRRIGVAKTVLVGLDLEDYLAERGYAVEKNPAAAAPAPDTKYIHLFAGIFLGIIGFAALSRIKNARDRVSYTLLTRDEEKVVKTIIEGGGELMQDQLPLKTTFSRPKVSRIVSDLEGRGIISKEPDGRTQKLRVKKDFYEEKR
ncbi:MAG: cell wall-binding repeat-containing protein [Candidatus Hydrothermarchaeaceae archaeon]